MGLEGRVVGGGAGDIRAVGCGLKKSMICKKRLVMDSGQGIAELRYFRLQDWMQPFGDLEKAEGRGMPGHWIDNR